MYGSVETTCQNYFVSKSTYDIILYVMTTKKSLSRLSIRVINP